VTWRRDITVRRKGTCMGGYSDTAVPSVVRVRGDVVGRYCCVIGGRLHVCVSWCPSNASAALGPTGRMTAVPLQLAGVAGAIKLAWGKTFGCGVG
jgi:hypothetical protein